MNNEDDFFYVIEKNKFDYFSSKGFNVVLQKNINVEDDESPSVYFGRKGISYINIECQHGHLSGQVKMIKAIFTGFINFHN